MCISSIDLSERSAPSGWAKQPPVPASAQTKTTIDAASVGPVVTLGRQVVLPSAQESPKCVRVRWVHAKSWSWRRSYLGGGKILAFFGLVTLEIPSPIQARAYDEG